MSDGLIEILDHSIRSLIGGFRGYAKFPLRHWRHRQVKIDGLAYLVRPRFPWFFCTSREASLLRGKMNECCRH